MYIEIVIVAIIIIVLLFTTGQFDFNKLVSDNEAVFKKLKEDDWDFLIKARYGNSANSDIIYNKRVKNAIIIFFAALVALLNKISFVTILICVAISYATFKLIYLDLKSYYKKHMTQIDAMLPYYLKSIEILIQHYTVPVALGKSISDAPEIFQDGLHDLINAINSGDDSINPYMDFAKTYPVRDSMRMMRLLYRLSIGSQEHKQEQLISFSKSISSLQQKARETKYKNRLEKMEGMTMRMLVTTGIGVMILLVFSVLQMMKL